MIIAVLIVLGLALGSFVNALVWRVREQEKGKTSKKFSIVQGRSMCPNCEHELAAKDLIPVISWLSLRGKCRYCGKTISALYPLVELSTAALFVISYLQWPNELVGGERIAFAVWLVLLVGLMALLVYDLRWKLLPNRILYPLAGIAGLYALIAVIGSPEPIEALINVILAVAVGGGIFYALYQVSQGKWIGGGDVKLGWLLGLIVATPGRAVLLIFLASLLGTLVSLPLLASKRLKRNSTIPFGPFLIMAAVFVQLWGHHILDWYQRSFFPYI
jgi:prepilin signal peptidase PulO-like enzyme (type II secretory pathway)